MTAFCLASFDAMADDGSPGDIHQQESRTWYVKADGTGDVPTIQAAVDSAINADIIILAPGTYTGEGNRDIYIGEKHIGVRSENGPHVTIIDCEGSAGEYHRGFNFHSGEARGVMLDGLTIQGGYQGGVSGVGGAVLCTASTPLIVNCVFKGNYASSRGGAIYFLNSRSQTLKNCTFFGNSAAEGSGIFIERDRIGIRPALLIDCVISFGSLGEAIGGINASPRLFRCNVYGNAAGDWTDCIADQAGINDNFSADPLFCDAAGGDFHITEASPCCPWNNDRLALIGALGVGCGVNRTTISPNLMCAADYVMVPPMKANIYLFALADDCSVYSIDTSTVRINGSIIPLSFEYLPPTDTCGDVLKMSLFVDEFIAIYGTLQDTTMQRYFVMWQYNDRSQSEAYGWVKMIGHRSGSISGDTNGDGDISLLDIMYLISHLYKGGDPPVSALEVGDVDGSGKVNLLDITYLISYLFKGGPAPILVGW